MKTELTDQDKELIELRKQLFALELFVILSAGRWPWSKSEFIPKRFEH